VNPELVMRAQGGDERAFADVAYAIADRLALRAIAETVDARAH
jgi:hypothetical protein